MNTNTKNLVFVILLAIVVIASSLMIIQTIEKTASEDVAYADTNWTGKGSGTKPDPYLITTAEQLGDFRDIVNASGGEKHAVLGNDITLTGTWTPIGTDSKPFKGTFDGNGHIISGLEFNESTTDKVGLFGAIQGYSGVTTIKNVNVSGTGITARYDVGGIVGYAEGSYTNAGDVKYKSIIINCHNYVPITGYSRVGGIVGNEDSNVTVLDCSNHASIKGTSNIGGIVGYAQGSLIGEKDKVCPVYIENCYNDNDLNVTNASSVGGIIGCAYLRTHVKKCFNYSSIKGTSSSDLGAIVGENNDDDCSFDACHYLTISDSATDSNAEGHDAAWFTKKSNFTGETVESAKRWDFTNTWEIKENADYPTFLPEVEVYIQGHIIAVGSSSDETANHCFSYERAANTLHLGSEYSNGPVFNIDVPSWAAGIRSNIPNLIINARKNSTIDNKNSGNNLTRYGIYATGNLTITAPADNYYTRVVVKGTAGTSLNFYGVYCEKNLLVDGGYLDVDAGNVYDDGTSTGIYAKSMTVNGGVAFANGYDGNGSYANNVSLVGIQTEDGLAITTKESVVVAWGYTTAIIGKVETVCSGVGYAGIPSCLTNENNSSYPTRTDVIQNINKLWQNQSGDYAIEMGTHLKMEEEKYGPTEYDPYVTEKPYTTIAFNLTPIHILARLQYNKEGYVSNEIHYNDETPTPEEYKHRVLYSSNFLTEGEFFDYIESKVIVSSSYTKGDWGKYSLSNIHEERDEVFTRGNYDYKRIMHGSFEVQKGIPDYIAPTPIAGLIYSGEAQDLIIRGGIPENPNINSTIEYKIGEYGTYSEATPQGTEIQSYHVFYKVTPENTSDYLIVYDDFYVTISSCDKTPLVNALNNAYTYRDSIPSKYTSSKESFENYIENIESSVLNDAYATAEQVSQAVAGLSDKIVETKKGIVAEAIDMIGTPTYPTSKQAILDAIDEYNNLDEELKPSFDQDKLNELAQKEEDYFKAIVNSLKPIENIKHTPETEKAINDAKDWFNNHLSDEQKGHLAQELEELNDEEDKYVAEGVSDLIKAIGNPEDVHYTDSDKEKIDAAKAALDQLTPKQKALIPQSDLDNLKDADDHYKADELVNLINDINDVSLDEESREKINKAIEAYDALSDEAKALVPAATLDKFEDAVDEYNDLVTEDVTEKINDIGEVQYTEESKEKIEEAMAAYDAMTDEQKALLPKDLKDKLEKAFSDYDQMDVDATRSYIKDEDNGVAIETEGRGVPRNVELRVEVKTQVLPKEGGVSPEAIQAILKKSQKIAKIYDVKLIQTEGGIEKEIQPSDIKEGMKIKVHMAIPEGIKTKGLNVLHIHNDGSIDVIDNVEVVNGEAIVEVSSFSEFALVEQTSHGFCVGWIVFIFVILELLATCLYIIIRYGLFKELVAKCKLDCLYDKLDLMTFIGLCVAGGIFLFAFIALCCHQCALTIIMFILALIICCAFAYFFLKDKGLIDKWIKQCKEYLDKKKVKDEVKDEPQPKAEEQKEEPKAEEAVAKTEEEAEAEYESEKNDTIEEIEAKEKAHEAITLKDSLVIAKATASSHAFSKKFIADYLRTKDIVEVNERENFTKTGLPLADTHYVDGKDGKKCFAYVYETEGSIILLAKMDDDYAKSLQKNHSQINKSAFPKQKNTWYSLILDDTYTAKEVKDILDELIGEVKEDAGMSLKESIALAKASTSHSFSKKYVCDYLKDKENVEVNTRDNYTRTGLPLADTHYVIKGDKKICFAYIYEIEGSIILLAKMNTQYAKELQKKHKNVTLSAFPKQADTWYSLIIDDTYSKEEFEKILDDIREQA